MRRITRTKIDWAFKSLLLILIAGPSPASLYAQQGEIPPTSPDSQQVTEAGEEKAIVSRRPAFYTLKRIAHPLRWLETGVRPIFGLIDRAASSGPIRDDKTPRESGVKVGFTGHGSSSGFGPKVTPFHSNLLGKGIEVELPLSVTYKLYQSAQFRINFPLASGGALDRLGAEVTSGYVSRASDNFFGVGNDTSIADETGFRAVTRTIAVGIESRFLKSWSLRADSGIRSVGITSPDRFWLASDVRSASEVFANQNIPGLRRGAVMMTTTAALQRDTRDDRLLNSGGLQRFEVSLNESQRGGNFSYWQYKLDLQQFIPISEDGRKVLAFRGTVETNQEKGGSFVPFFDLPIIGSHSNVRGYKSRRFTDKSALSGTAEYRFRAWRHLDLGVFGDAGQVAPELRDFAMDRFHTGYGIRFFVGKQTRYLFNLDVARSNEEKWKVYVNFTPSF